MAKETLQQLADRGIQVGAGGVQYSNTGRGNQYVPVSGSSNQGAIENTQRITPSMSLNEARSQADQAFSGLVSPMSLADIRAREAEQKAAAEKSATAQFNPQIAQEQKSGMANISTTQGVIGQNQGFNISTAEAAYLAGTQQEVSQRIKYVEDQKAAAINTGNLAAIQRADDQIAKLNEYNNQLTIAKANYALQLMSGNREQAQLELATKTQALQEQRAQQEQELAKETLKLNAYKTALDTPVGKDFTVDGVTYTGLASATGIDPSMISLSTDDKGYETGINKLTGEVIWKSKVPTGKTKTGPAVTNITMPSYGNSVNKVVSADGKNILGYIRFNSKGEQVAKQDINGNPITAFPTDAVIGDVIKESDSGWGI